jgi:hypothetical protein
MPDMTDLTDALANAIRAADPAAREALKRVLDGYARDFPEEVSWAIGASAPVLLHCLLCATGAACDLDLSARRRPPILPARDDSEQHDVDLDRIDDVPIEQGNYFNGWQYAHIWCRTHECFEWQWVSFEHIPDHLRPRPRPNLRVVTSPPNDSPDDCA